LLYMLNHNHGCKDNYLILIIKIILYIFLRKNVQKTIFVYYHVSSLPPV